MTELEDQLNALNKQLNGLTDFSISEKERMTKAGAKVFQRALKNTIKDKHYRIRKTGANPHLATSVNIRKGNRNGVRNGSYMVGFKNGKNGKAHIANFIENGTRIPYIKTSPKGRRYRVDKGGQVGVRRDPFVSETRANPTTQAKVLEAMLDEYNNVLREKFNGE